MKPTAKGSTPDKTSVSKVGSVAAGRVNSNPGHAHVMPKAAIDKHTK